jgi:signal recognition particle receptor subunit beta
MVQINFAQKTVNAKVVYYGPGMSGKTTNLEVVHQRAPDKNRGELTSISTDGDRTLFFDYMPLDLGTVAGMRTAFQIYTVPGQVYYNSTRKLVLQGVDGVVFVADSSASMLEQNLESLRNLEENLAEYGKSLATTPHVIQYNKRDLPDAMPVAELDRHLNPHGAPTYEAVASSGQGVFPTLKALASAVLKNIMKESQGRSSAPAAAAPAPAPTAPRQAPAPARRELDVAAPSVSRPAPAKANPAPNPYAKPAPARAAQHVQAPAQRKPAPPSPGRLMQSSAKPVSARSAPRAAAHAARAPRRELTVPQKRGGGKTAIFIVVAASVGAALAWFLLRAV